MDSLDMLLKERDEAFSRLASNKEAEDMERLFKVYRGLEREVTNHPDYLSRFSKRSTLGSQLRNTTKRLSNWLGKFIGNINSSLRRKR